MSPTQQPVNASVIWLHGLGADAYDFQDIVPQIKVPKGLNIRYVFPHAPVRPVTINNNEPTRAWYDICSLTDLNQKHDEVGIIESQQLVHELVDHEKSLGIPAKRIVMAGYSQGGAMNLYTSLRYPEKLAGILALSTYLPMADKLMQEAAPANKSTSIFMAHGQYDEVLSIVAGEMSRQALLALSYQVDWHTYPMGHAICPQEIQAISGWLAKVLAGGE
jgi:phospholipase/carboxylesterase